MDCIVRPMELRDITQVAGIEREAFPPPWPVTNFKKDLTSNNLTNYIVAYKRESEIVDSGNNHQLPKTRLDVLKSGITRFISGESGAEDASELVLGFAGVWFLVDEAHLSNIAVRSSCQQKGVGEYLLIAIIDLAIQKDVQFVTLEVRASNEAAKALYRKYDFIEVGVRHSYYTDNSEDAVIMTVDMILSRKFRGRLIELKQAHARRWDTKVDLSHRDGDEGSGIPSHETAGSSGGL